MRNILNFIQNTKELLLIYQEMKYLKLVPLKAINILLSPQFYTLVREDLPVKYAYEAKRIAPSLFEGLLEEDGSYQYYVEKEEDTWMFIAYDSRMIASFLESKGLGLQSVSKMYFAQQSIEAFEVPLVLGESNALVNINGTVTILPQVSLGNETLNKHIDKHFFGKKGVKLVIDNEGMFPSTETYTLVAIFVLWSAIYVLEASRYNGADAGDSKETFVLLEKYPSLESAYKRDSILSKYREIDKKERMKRDVIKSLSRMIFKGSVLTSLSLKEKSFQAEFTCTNTSTIKRLKELAKKESFIALNLSKTILKIEGMF
jgi:hypothetical protein